MSERALQDHIRGGLTQKTYQCDEQQKVGSHKRSINVMNNRKWVHTKDLST